MSDNSPQIEQKAEGSGIAQAAGHGATAINFFGMPIEKYLTAQLIAIILIQGLGYTCSFGTRNFFSVLVCSECFPVLFGIPSFFGLVMGFSLRNTKVVILSLVSGVLSLFGMGVLQFVGSIGGSGFMQNLLEWAKWAGFH